MPDDPTSDRGQSASFPTQGVTVDASAGETMTAPIRVPDSAVKLAALRLRDRDAEPGASGADLEVISTLGEGGMGVVHLASQPALRREVAVKRLRHASPQAVARLVREAQITGRLEHPNIVPVHALGLDTDGLPVVVMKRISGESWLQLIRRGSASIERHVEILIAVCNATQLAHERGLVHRDVKPENVMVGALDEIYLVDWGVALDREDPQAMREHGTIGTPNYMAPEMVAGDPARVDARTDVYLLGASLHHAVTGAPPHDRGNVATALYDAALSEPHTYDDAVPGELVAILHRACHRDPEERYPTAIALRDALRRFLEHRAARELALVGRERVLELDGLLADMPEDAPEPPEVRRAFDEASFAFRQALRIHDDPSTRSELRRAAEHLFDHRIARRDIGGASTVVDALDPEDEPRHRSLERLREELAEKEVRLSRLEHDRDHRVGRTARVVLSTVASLLAGGFGALSLLTRTGAGNTPASLRIIGFVAVPLIILLVGIYAFRRRLLVNELGRVTVLTAVIALISVLIHRILWVWIIPDPFSVTFLLGDQGILTACVATLMLRARWTAVACSTMLVAWGVMAAYPDVRVPVFVASSATAPALVAWAWWRAGRESR